MARLVRLDPRLALVLAATGCPQLRRRPAGFAGLCAIVLAQQVSAAAARAIAVRLEAGLDGPPTPEAVLAAGEPGLRAAGLSRPKIRTLIALAQQAEAGALDLAALAGRDSAAARAELVRLPGIGPWTAEVYLLFALGRADAFPAGDLALQVAASEAFGLGARCDTAALERIAEAWRPLRGVAAQLLWAYYALSRRSAASVLAAPA
ncbi:MAG TPA: DNA-3-methyladenine glycosylase 2 family protein [Xanthobacteraceae bacterium]|nr:DNA-3-methyladenine glycosylase 2 family protein [Xanthobacteraceae bacterium]